MNRNQMWCYENDGSGGASSSSSTVVVWHSGNAANCDQVTLCQAV